MIHLTHVDILVNFGLITPEIMKLEYVQQAFSSVGVSLTVLARGRHCYVLCRSVLGLFYFANFRLFSRGRHCYAARATC